MLTLLYMGVVQLLQGEGLFQRDNHKSSKNGDAEKMDFNKTPYGRLPKSSNTLNIRTLKIIAKYNFKMFPKSSNSG